MPRTFVALDLETTGLNPERDAIIEVAAVKFRDDEPVDRFTTLINPGRPIPYEIQQLTGISNADVLGKPRFELIAPQLTRFVGSLPVVGHNVSFDLGFLRPHGLLTDNLPLDTWELATILLPNQAGYSLGVLADRFGLAIPSQHRALDDATATGNLFLVLGDRVSRLPHAVLLEIGRLARGSGWPLGQLFEEALIAAGVVKGAAEELPLAELAPGSPLFQPWRAGEPLTPVEQPAPVDVAALAAMLKPGGAVGRAFPGYEFRPPQVAMLEAVANAFNQNHHLFAEAGTGTGKSIAYLLPAIAYARQNGSRVVVSTNTINLQDQLFKKDLPDLQRILAGAWGQETPFRATLLKGRSNYLCPRRFAALKARPRLNHDELRVIARILVWLPFTQTGDQSEISLPQPSDRFVWSQVAADNEGCSLDRCQRDMGGRCFFFRARKQAEASHIVVVNHALLMADAATDYRVLPEYKHLIIDEAHHLEDAVTDQLSFRADSGSLSQLFTALFPRGGRMGAPPAEERVVPVFGQPIRSSGRGKTGQPARAAGGRPTYPPGQLGEIAALLDAHVAPELAATPRELLLHVQADVEAVHVRLEDFWTVHNEAMAALQPQADNSEYDVRIRITSATRNQPVWVEIEVSWENLALTWQQASKRLAALAGALRDLQKTADAPARLDEMLEGLANTERRLDELYGEMEAWVVRPESNGVYWVEIGRENGPGRRVTLRTAPLHVGPLVQEHVLFHNDTVILTSATLRTAGSFEYLRDRLAAAEADTVAVGSPFDYRECTLLYLPTDLPEPNAPAYQTAVEQALAALAKALGGRTLALFTSYAQLRRTRDAIVPALREAGVEVLSQGGGTSRHQLLESFKAGSRTILLGTRSFWEGVDVVGPALSALALVRLPFAVPSDPIVAARSETFDDAFYHYSVPDAILRFRQGFGRLIRSKTDRGVVVVLDKRVQSKGYGQLFLDSLPECTVHKGPLMNLPTAAQRWVDGRE